MDGKKKEASEEGKEKQERSLVPQFQFVQKNILTLLRYLIT